MAKDPAFLFYPGDWQLGTMHMTLLEKGAYVELLMLQFARGKFTEAQAKHMLNGSFDVVWATVSEKFNFDGKHYLNNRLEEEKIKRQKFTESRRNNGLVEKTKKNNNEAYAKHMDKRMEDENEIENVNKKEDKNIPEKKDFMQYVKERCAMVGEKYELHEKTASTKYDAWVQNGWKDLKGNKIDNWKGKVVANLQYFKSTPIVKIGTNGMSNSATYEPENSTNYDKINSL